VALEIPLAINVIAVFVGALLGTIRAGDDDKVDLTGVFTLAAALGFGGGITRDVLLGNLPPAAFRDPTYIAAATAATLVGSLFLFYLKRLGKVLWVLDALSIGLFASVGVNAAVIAGLSVMPAVMIGTIASVGGLILADALQAKPSTIMYVGPPNAVAGAAGAMTYFLLYTHLTPVATTLLAVAATFLVRLSGPLFHVRVPQPRKRAYDLALRRTRIKAIARNRRHVP